jgi:hypothetical protein
MTKMPTVPVAGFTPGERDYIRRELEMFFATFPAVAEGFLLKIWPGGGPRHRQTESSSGRQGASGTGIDVP